MAMTHLSTYDFFHQLSQCLDRGESLAEALSHNDDGKIDRKRAQKLQKEIDSRVNPTTIPDDGA